MTALEFDDSSSSIFTKGEIFLQSNRWVVLSSLVGLLLVSGGVFLVGSNLFESPKVEVLGATSSTSLSPSPSGEMQKIVVEISGNVERPGVYKVTKESRIDDLLVAAGGLSKSADRTYVEKNINRAGKLVDGQKVYIPKIGESSPTVSLSSSTKGTSSTSITGLININTASEKELDSLIGIGATRAQSIIDHRPYSTIEELVSKKVLPQSVFSKIKDQIVAQ